MRSSAASDVYKRQLPQGAEGGLPGFEVLEGGLGHLPRLVRLVQGFVAVSYTHLRAHETVLDLVCRLPLATQNVAFRPSATPPTPTCFPVLLHHRL